MLNKLKEKYGVGPEGVIITIFILIIVIILDNEKKLNLSLIESILIGVILITIGVFILKNAYANLPYEKRSRVLCRKGIYSFIRHPMYSSIIFCFYPSIAFFTRSSNLLTSSVIILILYYLLIKKEEKYLIYIFREEYHTYIEDVPAFFPKIWSLNFWRRIKEFILPHEGIKGYIDLSKKE